MFTCTSQIILISCMCIITCSFIIFMCICCVLLYPLMSEFAQNFMRTKIDTNKAFHDRLWIIKSHHRLNIHLYKQLKFGPPEPQICESQATGVPQNEAANFRLFCYFSSYIFLYLSLKSAKITSNFVTILSLIFRYFPCIRGLPSRTSGENWDF